MTILTNVRSYTSLCFDLQFSVNWWYWESFHVLFGYLCFFFGEMSVQVFCPFLDWGVFLFVFFNCTAWALCMFWRLICCWFVFWGFSFFMFSFVVQKLLSLIRSHLFYFWFHFHYFRRWDRKDIATIYVKECSAYIFLWEFFL